MTTLWERLGNVRRAAEATGGIALVVSALGVLALISFDGRDATWFHLQTSVMTHNWLGRLGATLAEALLQLFGVTAFLVPFLLAVVGWGWIRHRRAPASWRRPAGFALLTTLLATLAELLFATIVWGGQRFAPGGYLGERCAGLLEALVARPGAYLVAIGGLAALTVAWAPASFARVGALAAAAGAAGWRSARAAFADWRARRRAAARRPAPERPAPPPSEKAPAASTGARPSIALADPDVSLASERPQPRVVPRPAAGPARGKPPQDDTRQPTLPMERGARDFSLPPLDLLNEPETQSRESEKELLERARQLTEKFAEFAINGSVVAIHPGPVVTTFEFKPDAGVKYSKITGMTEDLSLALKAESVRIDRMAGRSTVGIEVPNRKQETIYPRELIVSDKFRQSRSRLTLALGKDLHGDVACTELDRAPHLLIAGATGAGKSVGLNGMIVSMLYKATPRDLRFIMIDTKMIELGIYAGIPHLLIPVVTDPKHASAALRWAVREMEARYKRLAAVGVRNIAQFNALVEEEPDRTMDDPRGGEPIVLEHLPYIVIVIDEMADLMMVSSADVEESVMRLAQMARAVGIHLILATQRPSVDVITGTIKANFPARIAFRVSQRVDSRTIIDQQGAEHLLGRGDMLFLPTGSARVQRMHSGFITEAEINRITSWLKKMAEPQYDESVLEDPKEEGGPFDAGERDDMYWDAVRTVVNEGKCSTTLIQRRLQLGYARAARIVDMMEQEGVVGPADGSRPREVLVGADFLEEVGQS